MSRFYFLCVSCQGAEGEAQAQACSDVMHTAHPATHSARQHASSRAPFRAGCQLQLWWWACTASANASATLGRPLVPRVNARCESKRRDHCFLYVLTYRTLHPHRLRWSHSCSAALHLHRESIFYQLGEPFRWRGEELSCQKQSRAGYLRPCDQGASVCSYPQLLSPWIFVMIYHSHFETFYGSKAYMHISLLVQVSNPNSNRLFRLSV